MGGCGCKICGIIFLSKRKISKFSQLREIKWMKGEIVVYYDARIEDLIKQLWYASNSIK
jgi:hypothetical protein